MSSYCPVSEEIMRDLNRELACLRCLVYHVGAGRRDTREIREKLTKSRRRCMDVCREIRTNIPRDLCDSSNFTAQEHRRFTSVCIGLRLLAKDLKILQKLSTAFPEKGIKSLFHYPTTFMFLDGSAARMMDGGGPSGASAESLQIYSERKEILELLNVLAEIDTSNIHDGIERKEIFTDKERKRFAKNRACGLEHLLCCGRRSSYL